LDSDVVVRARSKPLLCEFDSSFRRAPTLASLTIRLERPKQQTAAGITGRRLEF
jgi:hypothetical protein